jgi:Holliday junction resolvasome RuvABC endonuclease subunit
MPQPNPTILAIDPGLRDLGHAVLARKDLIDSGVLTLRHVPPERRLRKVREKVEHWIRAYDPDILVLEHIPKRPLDALGGLPALGRLLRRIAKAHGLEVATYSAKTARRTVVGNGWAAKPEVAKTIVGRFPELRVYRGQDRKWKDHHWQNMVDAIALGLHHQVVTQPPSRSRRSG